jgi:GTP pyrophosphokinase
MIRIQDIIDKVIAYHPEADTDLISRAYVYSARVHDGQVRLSGEPYLSHPLEVAGLLADMRLDETSIAAGLLHDVVEDTHTTIEQLSADFGPSLAGLVEGVTKISELTFQSSQERQAESIRKMILAMSNDLRVILIKLADRLHNMRTLQFHKEARQFVIAQETLDIYAPIASRLGIYWIKTELEDLAFMHLDPEKYRELEHLVAARKDEREKYISTVREIIEKKLAQAGIQAQIKGRFKHFYSIYNKMLSQRLAFEDVYDLVAFRIIVDTVSRCYEVLGIIHGMWRSIGHKFKDYIGHPKPNMYQSLHTTVIGPAGERVEFQIRTRDMDEVAESGIAAHWSYKEGGKADEESRRTFAWIQNIVEYQQSVQDPAEFLENVKVELFPDEVYVFSPKGEVITLPLGATPLDFAYAIHSQVGNQCIGAKINGRMVPLRTELSTGDSIEILTSKNQHPSKDWLHLVKTAKAKSRIRQWIKTEERERSLALGREMVEKAFKRHKLSLAAAIRSEKINDALDSLGYKNIEDLLAAVGYAKISPLQILRKFVPQKQIEEEARAKADIQATVEQSPAREKIPSGVTVKGMDGILLRLAKCCSPLPGEPIVGYITRGQGVTVHRVGCVNAQTLDPLRRIDVEWGKSSAETYPVRLLVNAMDRVGLLADLTAAISQCKANIVSANSGAVGEDHMANALFTVSVSGKKELESVIKALRNVSGVQQVKRV